MSVNTSKKLTDQFYSVHPLYFSGLFKFLKYLLLKLKNKRLYLSNKKKNNLSKYYFTNKKKFKLFFNSKKFRLRFSFLV